jgi:hypothetical protein
LTSFGSILTSLPLSLTFGALRRRDNPGLGYSARRKRAGRCPNSLVTLLVTDGCLGHQVLERLGSLVTESTLGLSLRGSLLSSLELGSSLELSRLVLDLLVGKRNAACSSAVHSGPHR